MCLCVTSNLRVGIRQLVRQLVSVHLADSADDGLWGKRQRMICVCV
jgi:hypothetical protein